MKSVEDGGLPPIEPVEPGDRMDRPHECQAALRRGRCPEPAAFRAMLVSKRWGHVMWIYRCRKHAGGIRDTKTNYVERRVRMSPPEEKP